MRNNLIVIFCFFLLAGFKPPQKNNNAEHSAALDKPLSTNHSLLWQISGNGLKQTSYLYGTIHVISNEDYFLGKNVKKKLEKSSELIMEMDLNNIDVASLTMLSLLDSGKTIKNYMSDSDYQMIQAFMLDSIGIKKYTFEMFYAKLKPFYLEQLIFIKHLGEEKESYEDNFKKIAEAKNIKITGLETLSEQLQFLEEIPLEIQLKSIIKTIKEYSAETKELDKLIQDYKSQNLDALTASFQDEDSIWKEKLLDKRNSSWIPKIKNAIFQNSCFIAVGAGHLGSENGLIELLKKQGFNVEPISLD